MGRVGSLWDCGGMVERTVKGGQGVDKSHDVRGGGINLSFARSNYKARLRASRDVSM